MFSHSFHQCNSSMAAIGIMIMIKKMRKQGDPGLMQAIYKVSPVILDIHTALYYSTEWLILSSLYNYFIMRLVTYPAHGLGNFITPKVCVYTSCRNHTQGFYFLFVS